MSSLLKTAMVWILALALPMQVLAAATMLHCTPVQQPAAAQPHAEHHAAAAHGPSAAHDAMSHGAGDRGKDSAKDGADDAHQCSACAACVAGAALPSSGVMASPFDPARTVLFVRPLREADIVLAGLERPPRNLLA